MFSLTASFTDIAISNYINMDLVLTKDTPKAIAKTTRN